MTICQANWGTEPQYYEGDGERLPERRLHLILHISVILDFRRVFLWDAHCNDSLKSLLCFTNNICSNYLCLLTEVFFFFLPEDKNNRSYNGGIDEASTQLTFGACWQLK
jgi:hypothetical protein